MKQGGAGRIVVVTGGASGIGRACCEVLAAKGWKVVVLDIDAEGAKRVAAGIGGVAHPLDVGDEQAVDAIAAIIERDAGPVYGLVNSAGILASPVAPENLPIAEWDRVVRVNQRGTYVACLAFGLKMAQRGQGAIVNIASINAFRSMPFHGYAPTKAAIVSITMNLAAEWGPQGVRVNAVSPGFTRSPALQAKIDSGERDVGAIEKATALRRLMDPEDSAYAVAFLLGDEAAAITGVNLPVEGGWLVMPSWQSYPGIRGDWP
ncbi:MAG TPA: SDR family oxidoreductase [Burkholderiales bacterium]|nr:SDR family oxidoreductase [Burkholderiales bacterium]